MSGDFIGSWLVTEYVFEPDGTLLGRIGQERRLEPLESGRIRVNQRCTPEAALAGHAMGAFAGEWVFDLSVSGRDRLYHGPDVIGGATEWAEGVMTGQGQWPRFGHTFRSFSVMVEPGRQLTGGTFSTGSVLDASIVGVAVPDDGSGSYPELPHGAVEFEALDNSWVSRRFGPVEESEAWLAPDDHRRRLVVHDATTGLFTTIEVRNGTDGAVTAGRSS